MTDGPKLADHEHMMRLVEQLKPETRGRLAGSLDDRFHEITGAPREGCDCTTTEETDPR